MSGSRKISELVSASTVLGPELLPIVQDGETRQVPVSILMDAAPVQSINGLTGNVMLDVGDLPSYSAINTAIFTAIASVSVRVDTVSLAVTSVQAYLLAQISVATSGGLSEAPTDGQIYGRGGSAWVPVSITAVAGSITSINAAIVSINAVAATRRPFPICFDFGSSIVPAGEYAKFAPAGVTFFVLPSCSGSQLLFHTSAFPATTVSINVMYPTSVTIGAIVIGVSGTAVWPAIATTSVEPGQTWGVQTSVSAAAGLTGLVITFAGYYYPA